MQGKIGRKAENIPTDVIHFDFNQQLLSLLEDEDLMQQENLVIDPDDPFARKTPVLIVLNTSPVIGQLSLCDFCTV